MQPLVEAPSAVPESRRTASGGAEPGRSSNELYIGPFVSVLYGGPARLKDAHGLRRLTGESTGEFPVGAAKMAGVHKSGAGQIQLGLEGVLDSGERPREGSRRNRREVPGPIGFNFVTYASFGPFRTA